MGVRAAVAEARGGGVDEARIARVQALPAIAELFHRARAKVLDERVRLVEQPLEDVATRRDFRSSAIDSLPRLTETK